MNITDVAFLIVEGSIEVLKATQVLKLSKEEAMALDAAMATAAYACGAGAVGTANVVQVATAAAMATLDELGVPPDSPVRQITETAIKAAGAILDGGIGFGNLIESVAVPVAAEALIQALEEMGVEEVGALRILQGIVTMDEDTFDWVESGAKVLAAGAGMAVGHAAAKGTDEERWAAMAVGAELGMRATSLGVNVARANTSSAGSPGAGTPGAEAPRAEAPGAGTQGAAAPVAGTPRAPSPEALVSGTQGAAAPVAGTPRAPSPEALLRALRSSEWRGLVDLCVGGAAAAFAHRMAERGGSPDVSRSLQVGLQVSVTGVLGQEFTFDPVGGREKKPTCGVEHNLVALAGLGASIHGIHVHALEEEAKVRRGPDPSPLSERVSAERDASAALMGAARGSLAGCELTDGAKMPRPPPRVERERARG